MTPLRRRLALYGLMFACVVGAVAVNGKGDTASDSVSEAVAAPRPQQKRVAPAPQPAARQLDMAKLDRTFLAGRGVDPFGVKVWTAAPAPVTAVVPVVPAAPSAPPLPFTFAGKLETEPGKWIIYLAKGTQSFALSPGDTFDSNYRFDGIESIVAVECIAGRQRK